MKYDRIEYIDILANVDFIFFILKLV